LQVVTFILQTGYYMYLGIAASVNN